MTALQFDRLSLEGAWIVRSTSAEDQRGSFARLWCSDAAVQNGLPSTLAQISHSVNSAQYTLRGMHFQAAPYEESKWVRCIAGEIYDVLLDLRPESKTFGKWEGVHLRPQDLTQLFIPPGIAHGFLTLLPNSIVLYAITEFYESTAARGVRWDDPFFAIKWPNQPKVMSPRDASYPLWNDREVNQIS